MITLKYLISNLKERIKILQFYIYIHVYIRILYIYIYIDIKQIHMHTCDRNNLVTGKNEVQRIFSSDVPAG